MLATATNAVDQSCPVRLPACRGLQPPLPPPLSLRPPPPGAQRVRPPPPLPRRRPSRAPPQVTIAASDRLVDPSGEPGSQPLPACWLSASTSHWHQACACQSRARLPTCCSCPPPDPAPALPPFLQACTAAAARLAMACASWAACAAPSGATAAPPTISAAQTRGTAWAGPAVLTLAPRHRCGFGSGAGGSLSGRRFWAPCPAPGVVAPSHAACSHALRAAPSEVLLACPARRRPPSTTAPPSLIAARITRE